MDYENLIWKRNVYATGSGGELILTGSLSGSFKGKVWGINGSINIQSGKEVITSNYKCHTEYVNNVEVNDIISTELNTEYKVVWVVNRLKKFKELYLIGE